MLSVIEARLADEPRRQHDLLQLRALYNAVDTKAFVPISPAELIDQRTPAFLLNLGTVTQAAVDRAAAEGLLSTEGLMTSSSWRRFGRFVRLPAARGVGAWLGTHFRLWKDYGLTPLWLVFPSTGWGRALEVRAQLEPWAQGEEKDRVVKAIVAPQRKIETQLLQLEDKEA